LGFHLYDFPTRIVPICAMTTSPLPVDTLSRLLNRDVRATQDLLNAMVAFGIVEECDGGYRASESARRYCQAVAQGSLPASSED
jgi:hypothetical protein